MSGQRVYVGVDVSKERLDMALRPSGECFCKANNERAVSGLIKRLKALNCEWVVVKPPAATRRCWLRPCGPRGCR